MTRIQKVGVVLLSIWLILANVTPVLDVNIPNLDSLLAVVGIAAGVALLVGFAPMEKGKRRSRRAIGLLLLGAWLVLMNILPLLGAELGRLSLVLNVLAVLAGVFLLLDQS